MAASVFGARLDLLVRLYDTTTGAPVDERNIVFKRDGIPVRPEPRDPGTYIFINTGREDFLMRIEVFGYEVYETQVRYEELDERSPECDVFLMPSENTSRGEKVLSFSGTLPFLKQIEAISLTRPVCYAKDYDPKKNELTLYTTNGNNRVSLSDRFYGILSADGERYERIEIESEVSDLSVRLREPLELEKDRISNLPLMRVIFGTAEKDGSYLLRARESGSHNEHLVRYVVRKKAKFQKIGFNEGEMLQ